MYITFSAQKINNTSTKVRACQTKSLVLSWSPHWLPLSCDRVLILLELCFFASLLLFCLCTFYFSIQHYFAQMTKKKWSTTMQLLCLFLSSFRFQGSFSFTIPKGRQARVSFSRGIVNERIGWWWWSLKWKENQGLFVLNGFDYSSLLPPSLSTFVTLSETDIRVEKRTLLATVGTSFFCEY